MLRIPEPKAQAKLLATLLNQEGLKLPHQKALEIVARMYGHRDWNTLAASLAASNTAPPAPEPADADWAQALKTAAEELVASADDAGCEKGLTVVDAASVNTLAELLKTRKAPSSAFRLAGFGVQDVLTVRPDLSDEQALQALQYCKRNFDAEVGLNWTVLEMQVDHFIGEPYVVEGTLVSKERQLPVVVNLATGRLKSGTLEEMRKAPSCGDARWDEDFADQPYGAWLNLPGGVQTDMSAESRVCGGASDELHALHLELVAAGVSLAQP